MQYFQYLYKGIIQDIYDGDTFTVDIDLGFGTWLLNQKVRLVNCNTPEIRGIGRKKGLEVRDFLRTHLCGSEVVFRTFKAEKGKYGRWLVDVYIPEDVEDTEMKSFEFLSDYLVSTGKAKPYKILYT